MDKTYIAVSALMAELDESSQWTKEQMGRIIDDLPAADVEPVDRWIPVSEPPDLGGGRYLVWTDNSGVEVCRWSEKLKRWMGGAWTSHITHWQPMIRKPSCGAKMDGEGLG